MQYSSANASSNKFRLCLYSALLGVFVIMLFFGLRPKSGPLNENFSFIPEQSAAQFANDSMLLVPSLVIPERDEHDKLNLHMVFKPGDTKRLRLRFLVQVRSDEPQNDFVIAQWDQSLIILNGDDFSNAKKQPKIYVKIPQTEQPVLLSITSDNTGTWVYFDGQEAAHNKHVILTLPEVYANNLILGNDDTESRPWLGRMYGINLFYTPDEFTSTVLRHHQEWQKEGMLPTISGNKAITNLNFTKEQTDNLMLVKETPYADRSVLEWPAAQLFHLDLYFIFDIVINFIGFMPFGLILMMLLPTNISLRYRLLCVSLVSYGFSLSIEVSQIWIPLRHSSSLDLLLNTSGGLAGALSFIPLLKKSEQICSFYHLIKKRIRRVT
ncbi:VanZ family protein [Vibrio sp. WJH972]